MNKRGQAFFGQIKWIFYLTLAVLVVLILIQKAKYVSNEEQYVNAYSKNIAMTVNSLLYTDYETTVEFIIIDMFND